MLIGREPGLERGEHRLEVLGAVVEVLRDLVLLLRRRASSSALGDAVGPAVELAPTRSRRSPCTWAGASGTCWATASQTSAKFQPGIASPSVGRRRDRIAVDVLDRTVKSDYVAGDGLRAAARRRPAPARGAGVAGRAPGADRAAAGRGRLRRAALAAAVGARRRPDPPAPHRRGAGRGRACGGPAT